MLISQKTKVLSPIFNFKNDICYVFDRFDIFQDCSFLLQNIKQNDKALIVTTVGIRIGNIIQQRLTKKCQNYNKSLSVYDLEKLQNLQQVQRDEQGRNEIGKAKQNIMNELNNKESGKTHTAVVEINDMEVDSQIESNIDSNLEQFHSSNQHGQVCQIQQEEIEQQKIDLIGDSQSQSHQEAPILPVPEQQCSFEVLQPKLGEIQRMIFHAFIIQRGIRTLLASPSNIIQQLCQENKGYRQWIEAYSLSDYWQHFQMYMSNLKDCRNGLGTKQQKYYDGYYFGCDMMKVYKRICKMAPIE